MKNLIRCLTLTICMLLLVSCAQIEAIYYSIFVNNQRYNSNVELTSELEASFIDSYFNAALEAEKTFDISQIKILNYYGAIGKAHIVKFNKACPGQVQYSIIEGMKFIGYSQPVYLIFEDTLYTIEDAYEQKIINFDNLCRLFGINSSGKDTFNKEKYEKLSQQIKLIHPDEYELYYFLGYYGEYNGYSVVTYDYRGLKDNVTCWEICYGLSFRHGDASNTFMIMNGENLYFLNGAFENGILTLENVLEIFEIHTRSAKLSESLLNQTLSCLKKTFEEQPIEKEAYYSCQIEKYFGQYGDVHIFNIFLYSRYYDEENVTVEDRKLLLSMHGNYAFDGENFYTLDEAVELGLITEETKSQIR